MNTDVQTQNALMPMDGFSDIDPTSSPLRGPGVRFKDDAYFSFSNKLDVKGKTYAVIDLKRGWQKLEKDCPPEYLMRELGKPMPPQPAVPKEKWPANFNGQPEHPWKSTHYLVLLDIATGEVSTFWTNTVGGRVAVGALKDQVDFMRQHRPDAIPVIALESVPMPTQYGGTKPRPHFKICGWRSSTANQQLLADKTVVEELETVEAPSLAEEMNDDLPDYLTEAPKAEAPKKKPSKK